MGSDGSHSLDVEELRGRFAQHGQEHVFRFWDRLDAADRRQLAAEASELDLPALQAALEAAREPLRAARSRELAPIEVERLPGHGGDPERREAARRRGETLLGEGRIALLVVAGGQASRLGHDAPKGTFPIGPVTDRSLFELQAQKIRRLRERFDQPICWLVMTSEATDEATRRFFEERGHFGLPSDDVVFFRQAMVPSFDLDGRLMLASPGRLSRNPDGHGGSLTALLACGALDDLEDRGVTTLFYYQVDNPLVCMGDPVFLGFHAAAGAEVSCKVVRKSDPDEKVGVVARVAGEAGVVEYTELDAAHRSARDAAGDLVYWAGNIAIHAFETSFVRRVAGEADRWLPFHVSEKKIPGVDDAGHPVEPSAPNGRKLERFVFDALPAAKRVCVVETERSEEFSPVKNATGADSPATARRDLVACYRAWLAAAGLEVPRDAWVELDHAIVDSAEDARRLGWRDLREAGGAVRIEPGAAA